MLFPVGDDNSSRRPLPVVTYALIALNVLVFFIELNQGESFIRQWAVVPRQLVANPSAEIPTIFTAMFMHAGWMHLLGNMLFLWIFGDNVEDYLVTNIKWQMTNGNCSSLPIPRSIAFS
jgi:membrane associated rhomboid family serine protease